jgi:hypothetical protein
MKIWRDCVGWGWCLLGNSSGRVLILTGNVMFGTSLKINMVTMLMQSWVTICSCSKVHWSLHLTGCVKLCRGHWEWFFDPYFLMHFDSSRIQLKQQTCVNAAEPWRWGRVELVLAMLDSLHCYGRQLFSCAVYIGFLWPSMPDLHILFMHNSNIICEVTWNCNSFFIILLYDNLTMSFTSEVFMIRILSLWTGSSNADDT